ncbi:MAG: hypothetical protein AAFU64_11425 [Bacteroidota bacterium]
MMNMPETKQLSVIILFLGLNFPLWAQFGMEADKLNKVKINEAISVSLPSSFEVMDEVLYSRKYGAYRPPIAIYTSNREEADFGINESVNRSLQAFASSDWKMEDMQMIKGVYKASIAGVHSEVDFIQDDIREINGRSYIVLELVGTVRDEDKAVSFNRSAKRQYYYMQYTVYNGKILIFNFNCPGALKQRWQATARQVMDSIKVK